MNVAPVAKDPTVLTYLTLRKAVGAIAVALPFVLAVPWWFLAHQLQGSISLYYYTGMRNLFVGALCGIAMFLLSCRGFDREDQFAGIFAALCAIGVAFCPTTPVDPSRATPVHDPVGTAHYVFAGLLFATLAYFCLVLFRMTAVGKRVTVQKLQRNRVYTVCGIIIIASMLAIGFTKLLRLEYSILGLGPVFCFETTSLLAFGVAWLVKGETFLKDQQPEPVAPVPPSKQS
jgi:hypothetical protein